MKSIEITAFVVGKKNLSESKSSHSQNTIIMRSSTIVLWTLLGVAAAITAFTFAPNQQVRHLVVFKYKADATAEQIAEVTQAFKDLKNKIPGIVSIEHGKNISPEKKDLGFNYVYLITFENVAARDAYLPHPDHEKFGQLLGRLKVLEDVFVVDFSAQ